MCVCVSLCRLTCLSTCLDLVKRCCLLYKDLTSFTHIFQPMGTLLSKHLPVQTYPALLQVGARVSGQLHRPVYPKYTGRCALGFIWIVWDTHHSPSISCIFLLIFSCYLRLRSFTVRSWQPSAALLWLALHWFLKRRSLFLWNCSHLRLLKCK